MICNEKSLTYEFGFLVAGVSFELTSALADMSLSDSISERKRSHLEIASDLVAGVRLELTTFGL